MTESHCQTTVGIVKSSVKSIQKRQSRAKHNQIVNSDLAKEEGCIENTSSNMVVRGIRNKTRKHLSYNMDVIPIYSLGQSLKSAEISIDGDSPYSIKRIDRFPRSVFQIDESVDKDKRYRLFSNFSGNRYNFYQGPELLLTIVFESGLCRQYPFRSFSIYYKAQGVSFTSLFKKDDSQDLETLFEYPDNKDKIKKMENDLPNEDENGNFTMNFGKKNVLPAVENSVVIDASGETCMSMVKLGDNAFQVSWGGGMLREWGVALALASLDFKWALE